MYDKKLLGLLGVFSVSQHQGSAESAILPARRTGSLPPSGKQKSG
jgi:hypothetical protein